MRKEGIRFQKNNEMLTPNTHVRAFPFSRPLSEYLRMKDYALKGFL